MVRIEFAGYKQYMIKKLTVTLKSSRHLRVLQGVVVQAVVAEEEWNVPRLALAFRS